MLDRTLLDTAVTRAESQALLVGDAIAAKAAVEWLPHAVRRTVGLRDLVVEAIEALP